MRSPSIALATLFAGALGAGATAHAGVMDARSYTRIAFTGMHENVTLTSEKFGTSTVVSPAGSAQVTTGLNGHGAPIVHLQASTANTRDSEPYTQESVTYGWEVTGAGTRPVLVHVATSGHIRYDYGYVPDLMDTYNLYPNLLNVGLLATFGSNVPTGYDQRHYGLQTGFNLNWGIERLAPTGEFDGRNGGASTVDGDFAAQFDLWVLPNAENVISLEMTSFLYENTPYVKAYATESFSIDALLDPVITIDPQFANDYQLDVSAMPTVDDVPEPSAAWLFLAGMAALGAGRARAPAWRRRAKVALLCASVSAGASASVVSGSYAESWDIGQGPGYNDATHGDLVVHANRVDDNYNGFHTVQQVAFADSPSPKIVATATSWGNYAEPAAQGTIRYTLLLDGPANSHIPLGFEGRFALSTQGVTADLTSQPYANGESVFFELARGTDNPFFLYNCSDGCTMQTNIQARQAFDSATSSSGWFSGATGIESDAAGHAEAIVYLSAFAKTRWSGKAATAITSAMIDPVFFIDPSWLALHPETTLTLPDGVGNAESSAEDGAAVPEPQTWTLVLGGIGLMALRPRRVSRSRRNTRDLPAAAR